jgi:tryptophanyl-tRNA synthetase
MQYDFNCFFFIADLHSLTTHPTPGDLHGYVKHVLVEYLACGIDPEETTIYIQSDVPEVTELYLYLNMNAYMANWSAVLHLKIKSELSQITLMRVC